jgi:hypothetical protein
MMKRRFAIALVAYILLAAAWLGARPKELWIVLKWNPNAKPVSTALDTTGGLRPFRVAPIKDSRTKGEQVGENVEKKVAVPVYTKSNVAEFVRDNFVAQLQRTGFEIETGESSQLTMRSEIVEFWVSEGEHYDASVRLRVSMIDSAGKELWSGMLTGASNNFGRSLKPDNYTEAFSNSILELTAKVAATPAFRQAISKAR